VIGKLVKGNGMAGLTRYLLRAEDNQGRIRESCRVIGGTVKGDTSQELTSQFNVWKRIKPELKNSVVHESLRLPPGESLDESKWREVGEAWAQKMGFEAYTVVLHGPDHCHVAALRIKADGSTISDAYDYRRSERIIRALEQEYNLTVTASSHLLDASKSQTHRAAPTQQQIALNERTGAVAPSIIVAEAIDRILSQKAQKVTAIEYVEKLAAVGITANANVAATGKMNGFSYELDGVALTSKALGKSYTWSNLESRGVSYEQGRDFEKLREARVIRESTGSQPAFTSAGADRAEQLENPGIDRAERSGAVDSGRSAGEDDSRRRVEPGEPERLYSEAGITRGSDAEAARVSVEVPSSSSDGERQSTAIRRRPGGFSKLDDQESNNRNRRGGPGRGPGVEHIAGLAGNVDGQTVAAVKATLAALPDTEYEVGLLRRDTGEIARRRWSSETILKSINYLRRENALGREILFRPTDTKYLLLDDLKAESIEQMKIDGMSPALVTETSAQNYQAWIKLPVSIMSTQAKIIIREIVKKYDADPASADVAHFGKLAGFTNRKPAREFQRNGRILAPFVKLIEATGKVIERGRELIDYATKIMNEKNNKYSKVIQSVNMPRPAGDLVDRWKQERLSVVLYLAQNHKPADESVIDFRVAQRLLKAGYTRDEVKAELEAISTRKHDAADYAERTVKAAAEGLGEDENQTQKPVKTHRPRMR
jgi:hypothetical protein